jgi:hypothetical protein
MVSSVVRNVSFKGGRALNPIPEFTVVTLMNKMLSICGVITLCTASTVSARTPDDIHSGSTKDATTQAEAMIYPSSKPRMISKPLPALLDNSEQTAASKRPRVFMAMHGSTLLANDSSLDNQWTYVREHLDGIFANNAGVPPDVQAKLYRKIKTRNVIAVTHLGQLSDGWNTISSVVQSQNPDIVLNREAVAIHTPNYNLWDGRTIADAEAFYVTNPNIPAWQRFKAVYTGWPVRYQRYAPLPPSAQNAFEDGKGMFMECLHGICVSQLYVDALEKGINTMHAQNKPYVMFLSVASYDGWFDAVRQVYSHLASKDMWRPYDVIMLINYSGRYASTPELINNQPADTTTGILYWAMHQQPIGTLKTELINAQTDKSVLALKYGDTISLSATSLPQFSVKVDAVPIGAKSVVMTWILRRSAGRRDILHRQVENDALVSLFGDTPSGDYSGAPLAVGSYDLQIEAFAGINGEGLSIAEKTLRLSVIN